MYGLIKASRPEWAKALIINALALSGRTNDNTIIRRVSLRFALGYALVGLSARYQRHVNPNGHQSDTMRYALIPFQGACPRTSVFYFILQLNGLAYIPCGLKAQ